MGYVGTFLGRLVEATVEESYMMYNRDGDGGFDLLHRRPAFRS